MSRKCVDDSKTLIAEELDMLEKSGSEMPLLFFIDSNVKDVPFEGFLIARGSKYVNNNLPG